MTQAAAAAERLREYEIVFVLAPNADNSEAERINGKLNEVLATFGGKLLKLDNWGRRKLAYPIKRHARGIFVFAKFIGKPGVVREIERNLRIADSVLRFQSNLTNPAVASSDVTVDPEDVKFTPVAPAEPEEELSFEQRLGLAPSAHRKAPVEDEADALDPEDEVPDLDAEPGGAPRRGES